MPTISNYDKFTNSKQTINTKFYLAISNYLIKVIIIQGLVLYKLY